METSTAYPPSSFDYIYFTTEKFLHKTRNYIIFLNANYKRNLTLTMKSQKRSTVYTIPWQKRLLISCSIKKRVFHVSPWWDITRDETTDRTTRRSSAPSRAFSFSDGSFFYRTPMTLHSLSLRSSPSRGLFAALSSGTARENGRGSSFEPRYPRDLRDERKFGLFQQPIEQMEAGIPPVNLYHISESFVGLASAWPMPNGPREFSRYRAWLSSATPNLSLKSEIFHPPKYLFHLVHLSNEKKFATFGVHGIFE